MGGGVPHKIVKLTPSITNSNRLANYMSEKYLSVKNVKDANGWVRALQITFLISLISIILEKLNFKIIYLLTVTEKKSEFV